MPVRASSYYSPPSCLSSSKSAGPATSPPSKMPGPWVISSLPLRARPNPHDRASCPTSSTQTRSRAPSGNGGPRRTMTTTMTTSAAATTTIATSPTMRSSRRGWAAARFPSTCAGRTWGIAVPRRPSPNRASRRRRTYQTIGPSRAARPLPPRPPLSLLGVARSALASTNPTKTTATSRVNPRGPLGISTRHHRRFRAGGGSGSSIRDPSTRATAPHRGQAFRQGRKRNRCRAILGTCRWRRRNAPSMEHATT